MAFRACLQHTHAACLVLNCVGLMPEGPCNSLSSLALLKGNISPPQVAPQKTRLYLQRASSQHKISMQKHAHRCTMENIHTHQRSFVAPAHLQICSFFFFLRQSSLRQFCCLVKDVCVVSPQTKRKEGERALFSLELCVSPENQNGEGHVGITS